MYFMLKYMNYKKWSLGQTFSHRVTWVPILTDHIRTAVTFKENGNDMCEMSSPWKQFQICWGGFTDSDFKTFSLFIHISIKKYGEVLRSEIWATFKLTIFAVLLCLGNCCHIDKTKSKNVVLSWAHNILFWVFSGHLSHKHNFVEENDIDKKCTTFYQTQNDQHFISYGTNQWRTVQTNSMLSYTYLYFKTRHLVENMAILFIF